MRFDGKDDHLQLLGMGGTAEELTAFVIVAPRSNAGGFRGILAGNAFGLRDYDTGFCLDLAPAMSSRFDSINVEGRGFVGANDLLNESLPFGQPFIVEVHLGAGRGGVALWLDGKLQGRRDRQAGKISLDDMTLGARFYTNDFQPAFTQGFFDGDIAEVLIYDRLLSDEAIGSVRGYLAAKYAGLGEKLKRKGDEEGEPLVSVAEPPPVQMFVPGFAARELPVQLTNVNNVRYRPDGKLFAVAYNGAIYLLSDRDGDGLEEDVKLFWDGRGKMQSPIGMALNRPGDPRGNGVFVASKGKCSLIVDKDGDDVADQEIVVAEGWPEIKHSVDAMGIAQAPDGSVYFGLGTTDFTNAFQVDHDGKAHYDVNGERGAILRIAPDFKGREVVATGIRFPVSMAFNRKGDLFATDQEGATWLPNGNPFDELLHIRRGRHYGFPPRHPKYLNRVIDEPSVFDYRPQHQSTCGLCFNEPGKGRKVFGPDWWADDAIVCGYSRGKLYRTKLVDTASGYVAQTELIACLSRLVADACVSPDGAMMVATHGGGPDWGSGPEGHGKLFKIQYVDRTLPQPVIAWAESEQETRIAFDRPVSPEYLRGLTERVSLTTGRAVAAGDRFESLRPGYEVVAAQLAAPRHKVKIHSASLTPYGRTILLATSPQLEESSYAITMPGFGSDSASAVKGAIRQEPDIDLCYGLHGVEAAWVGNDGGGRWSGWLPHPDLKVARELTRGSAGHDTLWASLKRAGTLKLRAKINLRDLLRPAYQPGSRVDDAALPEERVTLVLESNSGLVARSSTGEVETSPRDTNANKVVLSFRPAVGETSSLEIELRTGGDGPAALGVSVYTNEDPRPRALPRVRILSPWSRPDRLKGGMLARVVPEEWKGGDWLRGRSLFYGDVARCSQCHSVRGEGGTLGPDLSNLIERDYASVVRDISQPSFAINPDFVSYAIALNDGRVLSGPIRREGTMLHVGDARGGHSSIAREEVEELKPLTTSLMPEGLPTLLGHERMKDLLAFLLQPALEPSPIRRPGAPPPRSLGEIPSPAAEATGRGKKAVRPLHVVLVSGPKDHGIDEHDYPQWQERWGTLLGLAEGVTVRKAMGWPSADDLAHADVLVWYSANPEWSQAKGKELDGFLERGGGMVYIHFAVNGKAAPGPLAERIGLAWQDGRSRFRHGPLDLDLGAGNTHPITQGLAGFHLEDESYWELAGDTSKIQVLGTAVEEGKARPLLWTREHGKGKVFCSIPGHYSWTFDDPLFRRVILRGIAWSCGEPVDRFAGLATVGARIGNERAE
ncbi:ThuA domain-containing protein [Singulisphaera sp. PoT]|uniref:ThuA domain-containing protein n=1 Tax=Singulisphaera sp. PoT TaxID=3411797 RepID=UPI003BF56320